jgi:hypothetical protein
VKAVQGAPKVYLAQPLHLSTPDGGDVLLDAGGYEVTAGGTDTLRVVAVEGGRETLVQATETALPETVPGPAAASIPNEEDPDLVHLVFVHPDGKALEAIGSLSGVQSRALRLRSSTTLSGGAVSPLQGRAYGQPTLSVDKIRTCLRLDYGKPVPLSPFLYVVDALSHASWLRHNGAWEGIPASVPGSWDGPVLKSERMGPASRWIIPSELGVIYEITQTGNMSWWKQFYQSPPSGTRREADLLFGATDLHFGGWLQYKQVFSGGAGIIYAITQDGQLLWWKHKNWLTGTTDTPFGETAWEGPKVVGVGWGDLKHVFSGGNSVIYVVTKEGAVKWFQHYGSADGRFEWKGPFDVTSGLTNYTKMFSVGKGLIYGVEPNGNLVWYKDNRWSQRTQADYGCGLSGPVPVGSGWGGYPFVFGFLPYGD